MSEAVPAERGARAGAALPFDAIIFDFDGVLAESNSIKADAFAELYRHAGPEVMARVVDFHLTHGGLSRHVKLRHFHREFLGIELGEEELARLAQRFALRVKDAVVRAPWVAGAREFLDAYRGRMEFFVASGTPEEELEDVVRLRGMRDYFRGVLGAPTAKVRNVEKVLRENGYEASRVLLVGDSRTDQEAAAAHGVAFVGRRSSDRGVFGPDVVVLDDLRGLERVLRNWPAAPGGARG